LGVANGYFVASDQPSVTRPRKERAVRKPSPATIIASIALFFSLAGTGIAATHYLITSTSQIKPSVLKSLKSTGPRGPQGQQGPAGAAGAVGAAGAAGAAGTFNASDVTVVYGSQIGPLTDTTVTPGGGSGTSVVTCPAGDVVTGGGWAPETGTPDVTVDSDAASGASSWAVTLTNDSATAASPLITAVAECAG
jgi:hypothetical protein